MPCYDPRDSWDHTHSKELEKLLENLIEVIKARRSNHEDIIPFKDLSHEATRTLCAYINNMKYEKISDYSKQLQ